MKIKSKKSIKTITAAFNQLNPLEKSGLIKKDPSRQKYLNNIAKIRTPNRVIIPPILFLFRNSQDYIRHRVKAL